MWELVIEDMRQRHDVGVKHYGKALYAHDDVDKLWSLYEELLDAASYVRGEIEQRNTPHPLEGKAIGQRFICFLGPKPHAAWLHRNFGANLYWCPRHGMLMSQIMKLQPHDAPDRVLASARQMSASDYARFVRAPKVPAARRLRG